MPCRFLSTTLRACTGITPTSWREPRQVLDGMSGALVIEGIESYLPALAGLPSASWFCVAVPLRTILSLPIETPC